MKFLASGDVLVENMIFYLSKLMVSLDLRQNSSSTDLTDWIEVESI